MECTAPKDKREKLDFPKFKTLCFRGHFQESENTSHRKGEKFYESHYHKEQIQISKKNTNNLKKKKEKNEDRGCKLNITKSLSQ